MRGYFKTIITCTNWAHHPMDLLSARAARAVQPMLSYGAAFGQARSDVWDAKDNPDGNIIASVAENKLGTHLLQVDLRARTHARTHACTHARTHACAQAHTHAHSHMHTYIHARKYACTLTHVSPPFPQERISRLPPAPVHTLSYPKVWPAPAQPSTDTPTCWGPFTAGARTDCVLDLTWSDPDPDHSPYRFFPSQSYHGTPEARAAMARMMSRTFLKVSLARTHLSR